MYIDRNRRHVQTRVLAVFAAVSILAGPALLAAQTPVPTTASKSSTGAALIDTESAGIDKQSGNDVVRTLESDGRFGTLVTALRTSGLADELKTGGPYTIFAPTDEAFRKLPQDKRDALLGNREELREVLQYHVVSGRLSAADLRSMQSISQTSYHVSPDSPNSANANRPINATSDGTTSNAAASADGNQPRPDSQEGLVDKMLKDHNEPGDAYDPKGAVDNLLGRDNASASPSDTTAAARVDSTSQARPSSMAANNYGSITGSPDRGVSSPDAASAGTHLGTSDSSARSSMDSTYGKKDATSVESTERYGNSSASVNGSSRTTGAGRDRTNSGVRTTDPARSQGNDLRKDSLDGVIDPATINANESTSADITDATRNRLNNSGLAGGNASRPDSQEGRMDRMFHDKNEPGDAYSGNTTTTGTSRDVVNSDVASGNQRRPDNQEGVLDRMLHDENEPGDAYAPGTDRNGRDVVSEAGKAVSDSAKKASEWVSEKTRNAGDAIDRTVEPNGNSRIHALSGGGLRFSTADNALMVNNSRIISSDITASNGVIHAIDTVLTPDRKVTRNNGTKTSTTSDDRSDAPRVRTNPYESAAVVAPEPLERLRNKREIFGTDRHTTTLMPGTTQVQRDRDDRF